jgi:hypothetical protein
MRIIETVLVISMFIWGLGVGTLMAESDPPSREGRALKIEMDAYLTKFTDQVGIVPESMQWVTMVLPILEMDSPAVTYGWLLPPPYRWVDGGPSIWIAMFTFHEAMMLDMDSRQRRVVAGHEVAHMIGRCMNFPEPDLTGLSEIESIVREFNHAVIVESCADIVSAELTSPEDVLYTLRYLRDEVSRGNPVLVKRIQVMERVLELENAHE